MSIHHFHCTDGRDVVLDRKGRRVADEDVEACAMMTAARLMRRLPGFGEWSDWTVAVHDADGRCVAVVPFPPISTLQARPSGRRPGKLIASAWLTQQGAALRRSA